MSEVKKYGGELRDIIIPIPNNTIEMTVTLKVYENGEMLNVKQTFDLGGIKYAEDLFEQCCNGKYPIYVLTEKGEEYNPDGV